MNIDFSFNCSRNVLDECKNLYERTFDSSKFGNFNLNSLIAHENEKLIGFIDASPVFNYPNEFFILIHKSFDLNKPIPNLNENQYLGGLGEDLYVSRMAISEELRNNYLGSELLDRSLPKIKNHYGIDSKRTWVFTTPENPSEQFWLKNNFKFFIRYNFLEKWNPKFQNVFYKSI